MSGSALAHVIVSGLATGCIYALVALSLVIVYNATRTLNFAQGEMLMVSAFVAWSAHRAARLPLPFAFACGVAAGGVLAYVVERAIIRRAVSATHWDVLIITLGLSLALRAGETGRVVVSGPARELAAEPRIRAAYLGLAGPAPPARGAALPEKER